MQPIASSIAPSSRPVGADTPELSPESSDGFEALLAGLLAPPAAAPQSSSDRRPLTLASSAGDASEPGDRAAAPPEDGLLAPSTMAPLGAPLPAGASSPALAAGATAAGVSSSSTAGVPNVGTPSAKPGEPIATPADASDALNADAADQNALAAGIAKTTATGDAPVPLSSAPAAAGRPDGSPPGPHPETGRARSSGAAARLEQMAAGRHSQMAPAVAQAEHPAASAAGATARPMLPVFTMVTSPGELGRNDLQASFGELADGSLLRGLALPTAVGGEPSVASLTGTPSGAAVQPARQLAAVIDRAVAGEIRQLTIQLSPRELGAIDIALSFDEDRRLSISILAERPETLELLKGESRQLERLLGRQGIDLADAGLELGLMSRERHGHGNAHTSTGQHILQALGERRGEAEPLSDDTSETLRDRTAAALGADRRLNLSI